ncbi:HAMP domain-containing sensor histidine kinase [Paenibacillus filicis]|uniref:histidine kinase n=1 Tax=Paenibacillus filicis TaxID=669464 RepID=A0ABU9DGX0_9BACL
MKRDSTVLLLTLQFLMLAVLTGMEMLHQPQGIVRGVLWAALFTGTGVLLVGRLRLIKRLEEAVVHLQRAVQGNANTRILVARDEPAVREVEFAMNALIERLTAIQAQSVNSEAARKQLLSAISHDIRTPLTSIIGYVDALKDEIASTPEERQAHLEIISRKGGALKELIEQIFQLAKLDADDIILKPEPLDLAEAAREAVIEWIPELQLRQMEVEAQLPEKPCVVEADRLAVRRILSNLIRNAVQHGQEGGLLGIGLSLAENGMAYELVLWDRGPGISEEELPHVFERMYRTAVSRRSLNDGSGLGLAIAKALVEKQGGSIWAESEPGIRTAFRFTLPRADG